MCQLMANPSLKIAKHDIVCYKLLKQWENGAFHSYKELESALIDIEDASIVRCHIPKGSKYVLGYDLDDFPCYVSEKIVIDQVYNTW